MPFVRKVDANYMKTVWHDRKGDRRAASDRNFPIWVLNFLNKACGNQLGCYSCNRSSAN